MSANVALPDDCSVCLSPMVHPVSLPACPHRFCFLCIKGVALRSMRCPLCRSRIPAEFFARPRLPVAESAAVAVLGDTAIDDGATGATATGTVAIQRCWFYEGRNGWWQFEERHCAELEAAYNRSEPTCQLVIFGFPYLVDFSLMVQQRQDDATKIRRVKRGFDFPSDRLKGVAGLAMPSPSAAAAPSMAAAAASVVRKPNDDDEDSDNPSSSNSDDSEDSSGEASDADVSVNSLNSSLRQVALSGSNNRRRQPPQGHG